MEGGCKKTFQIPLKGEFQDQDQKEKPELDKPERDLRMKDSLGRRSSKSLTVQQISKDNRRKRSSIEPEIDDDDGPKLNFKNFCTRSNLKSEKQIEFN